MRAHADGNLDNVDLWQQGKSLIEKGSYTIVFVGTPRPSKKSSSSAEKTIYESEFIEPVRMDVKRDVTDGYIRRADNETEWDNRPLFQKYQFFTPGKSNINAFWSSLEHRTDSILRYLHGSCHCHCPVLYPWRWLESPRQPRGVLWRL